MGAQTHRRLVQHQQLGLAHQRAAHGQHLLLAAGERACHLLAALLQAGEAGKHVVNVLLRELCRGYNAPISRFSMHGHLQEDAASLRNLGQALSHDVVRLDMGNVLIQEGDAAAAGAQNAGNGLQNGGLARAVRADQRHDLALGAPRRRRP